MAPPRRPDPEPLETDDVRAVTVGTVAWAVLLLALLAAYPRLDEDGRGSWVWIAAAGFGLGLVGVRHVRRRRTALSRTVPPPAPGATDDATRSSDPNAGTSPGR